MRWLVLVGLAACGRVGFAGETAADGASGLVPLHDWRLTGTYDDAQHGPALTNHGGTITPSGYRFGPNQGLSVDGALPRTVYTLDIEMSFDTLGGWNKLVDYEDRIPDTGLYTYEGALQFVIIPGSDFITSEVVFGAGITRRITITRDGLTVVAYLDGALAMAARETSPTPPAAATVPFQFADTIPIAALTVDRVFFFMDDAATQMTEASSGVARRIRIYDTVLSAQQIADNP